MGAKKSLPPKIGVPAKDDSPKSEIEVTSSSSSQVLTDTAESNKKYHLREKKTTGDMGSASLLDDSTEPGLS